MSWREELGLRACGALAFAAGLMLVAYAIWGRILRFDFVETLLLVVAGVLAGELFLRLICWIDRGVSLHVVPTHRRRHDIHG